MQSKTYINRFISVMLIALLLISSTSVYGSSEPNVSMTLAIEEADNLNSLGLLAGSNTGYSLDKAPTRIEGLVMLIRMMGEEAAAKNCTYKNPFKDVPAWADRYAAWAYAKKYTSGTSAITYTPNDKMTAAQYLTFMLRALGYGSETTLQTAVSKAAEVGLIPANSYTDVKVPFLRADMIHIAYLALQTKEKSTGAQLYIGLIAKKAIDTKKAITIFNPELADSSSTITDSNGNESTGDGTAVDNGIDKNKILDFLGIGNSSTTVGQSNTPEKLYSYTNTNNNMSSYTVSISGNQVSITGTETTGMTYISLTLYEVKTVAADNGGINKDEKVLYKDILRPTTGFSESITIPALRYGNYFELTVTAQNDSGASKVMDKIWIKGTTDAWYFEGPTKITSNTALTQEANSVPLADWLKKRTNVAEDFKNEIYSLMGTSADSDYNTAYNVYTWITENIAICSRAEAQEDSVWVLENRKAICGGYVNLMVDALAAYGVPARVVIGEIIYATIADSFGLASSINHAWIEFYDASANKWVICDAAYGANISSCFFDIDRTYAANGRKIVRYK